MGGGRARELPLVHVSLKKKKNNKILGRPLSVRRSCSAVSLCGPVMCPRLLNVTLLYCQRVEQIKDMNKSIHILFVCVGKWVRHVVVVNQQTIYKLYFSFIGFVLPLDL